MIHAENISWFFLAELQPSKIVCKRSYFIYANQSPVCSIMVKINHSPNYKQWKMANNPVSWRPLKMELLKRTLLRWKSIHSLSPEYCMFMELSHTVDVFVCVAAGVVSKYFLFLCLLNALFQIMQVSNASRKSLISVWLNVAIPKIRCDTLSSEDLCSILWICPVHVQRSWNMYPCASLAFYKLFQFQWWLHA
jgi:hypothetical protein